VLADEAKKQSYNFPNKAAKRLPLPPSTLDNWLRAARNGKLVEIGKMQRPLTEVEWSLPGPSANCPLLTTYFKRPIAYYFIHHASNEQV